MSRIRVWKRTAERGSAMIEFTLVGIPLIFILISTFEMARGMWIYHTLAYAAKEGTRFVAVKGNDCITGSNSCAVTVAQVAQQIQFAGLGLDPAVLNIRLVSSSRQLPSANTYMTLNSALSNNTYWPSNGPGAASFDTGANPGQDIEIDLTYQFRSAIAMFWPGAGPGQVFGTFTLPATSKEQIQF